MFVRIAAVRTTHSCMEFLLPPGVALHACDCVLLKAEPPEVPPTTTQL